MTFIFHESPTKPNLNHSVAQALRRVDGEPRDFPIAQFRSALGALDPRKGCLFSGQVRRKTKPFQNSKALPRTHDVVTLFEMNFT